MVLGVSGFLTTCSSFIQELASAIFLPMSTLYCQTLDCQVLRVNIFYRALGENNVALNPLGSFKLPRGRWAVTAAYSQMRYPISSNVICFRKLTHLRRYRNLRYCQAVLHTLL